MNPIGVFDSGFGGLTVLRALRAALPTHDFVYLGDTGRAPYGGRDTDVILDLSEQCVERLFEEGCRLVVVACHTVSSVGLRHMQRRYLSDDPESPRRVLGVTIPAVEMAVSRPGARIGFIGTARTIASGTFAIEAKKLGAENVSLRAAPLLAAIVEEGWEDTPIARQAVERYVSDWSEIDTLVLGCTHYPLLMAAFRAALPESVTVLDPAPFIAARLVDWLARHPGFSGPSEGSLRVLSSGNPATFAEHGARFLGAPLPAVEHVAEECSRLVPRERPASPLGQVVR
ncbi:MAG: glutamate racemase [Polyangiaceae bacterium]